MILITGASKGVGRYLFRRFREDNFEVIGTFNNTVLGFEEDLSDYLKVDINDYAAIKDLVLKIKPLLSKIVLINCAAISYNSFAHKSDVDQWCNVIDVNLKGTFYFIRELLPIMREQGYGRIINFSSVVATLPTPGVSAYAASKAAIVGLTKSLAVENGSKGVTVNAINLGYTNIGMGVNDVPVEYQEKIKSKISLGRFCEPEEIYNTIKFLISTEYVNGASIDINGGII